MRDWLGIEWLCYEDAHEYMITEESHIKIKRDYEKWSSSGERPVNIPSRPEAIYKDDWQGWLYFLGYGPRKKYLDYEEARAIVHKQKIRNQQDWMNWYKTDSRPCDIPMNPHYVYREDRQGGWINWRDWLGENDKWMPYDELKEFIKQFDLRTSFNYSRWFFDNKMSKYRDDNDRRIPSNPKNIYKEWTGWTEFLEPKSTFVSFYKARAFARKLKLKSYKEWLEFCRTGNRPKNIPCNPNCTYTDEFLGYPDFLSFKPYRKRTNKNLKRTNKNLK